MLKKRSSRRRSARRATGQEEALEEGLISGAGTVWWSEWFVLLGQCADEEERWVRRGSERSKDRGREGGANVGFVWVLSPVALRQTLL
jgi:hypothetical protein